jgi:hypothetical protein
MKLNGGKFKWHAQWLVTGTGLTWCTAVLMNSSATSEDVCRTQAALNAIGRTALISCPTELSSHSQTLNVVGSTGMMRIDEATLLCLTIIKGVEEDVSICS